MKLIGYTAVLFLICLNPAGIFNPMHRQGQPSRGELRIVWYNVENLFFPEKDTCGSDDEFTPEGVRHWTWWRYEQKLTSIAKVIVASGEGNPPELVGLCEVENGEVLEALVNHPILAPYGYRYIHQDSPDHRGMDVACLYRQKKVRLVSWNVVASRHALPGRGTRDILHGCFAWGKRDTIDLLLVHLISRYSGAGATADARRRQVGQLIQLADSIQGVREKSLRIMAGDFNEEMNGYAMEPARNGFTGGQSITWIPSEGDFGSYKYQGTWSRIDHFLIHGSTYGHRFRGSILELPVLMTRDEVYGGMKPNRTYTGFSYNGGISDHLPVMLDVSRPFVPIRSER